MLPELVKFLRDVGVHTAIRTSPVIHCGERHLQLGSKLLRGLARRGELVGTAQPVHDLLRGMPFPSSHVVIESHIRAAHGNREQKQDAQIAADMPIS